MRRSQLIAALVLCSLPLFAATNVPSLTVDGDDGRVALAVAKVDVHVLMRGHLARTTFELTFRSSLDHDASGTFMFPLPPDAEVSDLGLYFDGHLRHAVALERVQARTAYEETVHRRVDPALAEWSSGRAFRFAVYPIPRGGTKTVHFAYDQEVLSTPYSLDLDFAQVERGDLTIDADTIPNVDGLRLSRVGSQWQANIANAPLKATVRITRDENDERALIAWSPDDQQWYAAAAMRIAGFATSHGPASHITIFWDASGSAANRDEAKLRAFLDGFFAKQQANTRVSIVPFHVDVEAPREVAASEATSALFAIPNAGATNLTSLLTKLSGLASRGSRVLLITDGIESLGQTSNAREAAARLSRLRTSITVVNASTSADDALLASIARATGGAYLDLTRVDPTLAVDAAMHRPARVVFASGSPTVRDLLPTEIVTPVDETVAVSARSLQRIVMLPIITGASRRELLVRDAGSDAADLVRRAWARAKLRALLDAGPPEDILEHGRHFNQLTPRTSFLVLDSWRDYEMYGVPMPAEVQALRDAELGGRSQNQPANRALQPVWFAKGRVVDGTGSPVPGASVTLSSPDDTSNTTTDFDGRFWITAHHPPKSATLRVQLEGFSPVTQSIHDAAPSGMSIDIGLKMAAVSEAITVTAAAPLYDVSGSSINESLAHAVAVPTKEALADQLLVTLAGAAPPPTEDETLAKETIEKRIATTEEVIARLRGLRSVDERLRYYLAARSVLANDKLFLANAASVVHETAPELGVRLITDLAEAYPDDAPLLRIVGRALDGWGRADLARPLFNRSIELAPRQPQSWRELILLEAREGHNDALSALRTRYAATPKDGRLREIQEILESELARTTRDRRIDPTAHLQVELLFDSNYSYVDLHVFEPGGEEVTWDHDKSAAGGKLIGWTAEGYGPEIYTGGAKPGTYRIAVQYYSGDTTETGFETLLHIVIYDRGERHDFFTALARPDEKKTITEVDVR